MRVPADRRRIQAARRDQPPAPASPEERERGVVAFSSGNHARGVAIAARRLGIRAIIVMPADAPQVKIEGTRGEGAEIVFYDRRTESREAIAARIADETGATVVPSFDDPAIVAGQGTAGLEIVEQLGGARQRGSSSPAAAAGWRRASRWPCRMPRSSSSSRMAGTTWRVRWKSGEIVPVGADAPPTPSAMRSDAARVADHLRHPARRAGARRCQSATPKWRTRSASPGSSMSWWLSRAARSAWRRCSRARSRRWRIRSWCCLAGMSIRRFMRGSSRSRLRRRCES